MEHLKLKSILSKLNIKRPFDVAAHIMRNNYDLYYPFMRSFKMLTINAQHGGHIEKFTFGKHEILFHYHRDDDRIIFTLDFAECNDAKCDVKTNNVKRVESLTAHRENDSDKYACLIIFVMPRTKIASIENISYHKTCVSSLTRIKGQGTFLLKAALAFMQQNKQRFHIDKVYLLDNSRKVCKKAKTSVKLSLLSILTTGETWYGKYGFIPYDPINDVKDDAKCRLYVKNKKIVSTTLVNQTHVEQYIKNALKKLGMESLFQDIDGLFAHYNNMPISTFLLAFTENFDNTCVIFNEFYEQLSKDLHIHDFFGVSFFRPL